MDIDTLIRYRGRDAIDPDGSKIGSIEEIYVDDATGEPEWLLVNTGLFGTKSSFVPVEGARPEGDDLRVAYSKDKVKDALGIDAGEHLDADRERELYEYYGRSMSGTSGTDRGMSTAGTDRGTGVTGQDRDARGTVGHDTSGPTTDDAMTRSEEEIHVEKDRHAAGKARLRKYVVTDHVETTVPVQREEVRIEREPITDANADRATDGPAISEEEHEVVLHEEEAHIEKRAVPKERVRLDKDTVTEQREVSEDVRREEIALDEDADTRR
jgi:uncharacterized protein (TIGR02271 family)